MTLAEIVKNLGRTIQHNSPTILTGLAVAGVASTAVLAVKGSFEAQMHIWTHDNDLGAESDFLEKTKMTWKFYIPAAGVGILTVACIIGSNGINSRRQAALISAYTIVETGFREYKEQTLETVGSQREQKLRDEISQKNVTENPPPEGTQVMIVSGNVLCLDTWTGRYFQSNMENLRKAMNDINAQCFREMSASQNEFYSKINLPQVETGEAVGWNMDNPMDLQFSSAISPNNEPVLVMNYHRPPIANFHKIW